MVDAQANPLIHGEERTRLINRAKITLNILPTWYDPALIFRFFLAAGNQTMVISEPVLPHCPLIKPGIHYIEAATDEVPAKIAYYLNHEDERLRIVKQAFLLVTQEHTFLDSLKLLLSKIIINPQYKFE